MTDINPNETLTTEEEVKTEETQPAVPEKTYISFEDFMKVELRIGKIVSAEIVEKSEKLLKLAVDFDEKNAETGEVQPRQVVSGIRMQFQNPEELVGRSFVFVTNLQPRAIMGLESQAMIVAGTGPEGLALMSPTIEIPKGTKLS